MTGVKGVKNARFDLVPYDALWQVALVFGFGAGKYAERNWEQGYDWSKSFAALHRHLALFWQGEEIDPESELPHLAHVAWQALVLLTFALREVGNDDRPTEKTDPGLFSMRAETLNEDEIRAAQPGAITHHRFKCDLLDCPGCA